MYFTHLECSSHCGAGPFNPRERHFLCPACGLPLLARYDLNAAGLVTRIVDGTRADHVAVSRDDAAARR
jgi:hypothetical protein